MESNPISGQEIKKATQAPAEAPERQRATAIGMTEQEQNGRGIPTKAASRTDFRPGLANF